MMQKAAQKTNRFNRKGGKEYAVPSAKLSSTVSNIYLPKYKATINEMSTETTIITYPSRMEKAPDASGR